MNTDTQLKQALAKMLPDVIKPWQTLAGSVIYFRWEDRDALVLDTELLYLCRLARQGFTLEQRVKYLNTMRDIIGGKVSDFDIADADWNKQVIALAKVKGFDIQTLTYTSA